MLQSLIVGFGHAGHHLHLRCLRKAREREQFTDERFFGEVVGVVDPKVGETISASSGTLRMFGDLAEVQGFDPARTVVHICTPPDVHVSVIQQAANLGYTKIIVEKPLALSMHGVDEVIRLNNMWRLDLLVVANWLFSSLTAWLKDALDSRHFGSLHQLTIEQHKPRFSRSLHDSGHPTAFDVEMPHQVALALYLGGRNVRVIDAACTDMQLGAKVVQHMGAARMSLVHESGLRSFLHSDLTAETRNRFLRLSFRDHTIEGHYPVDANTIYSSATVFDSDRRILETQIIQDDPLTKCLEEYYRYYAQVGERPVSDVGFNAIIVSTIAQAKVLSGIPS